MHCCVQLCSFVGAADVQMNPQAYDGVSDSGCVVLHAVVGGEVVDTSMYAAAL